MLVVLKSVFQIPGMQLEQMIIKIMIPAMSSSMR